MKEYLYTVAFSDNIAIQVFAENRTQAIGKARNKLLKERITAKYNTRVVRFVRNETLSEEQKTDVLE